MKKRRFITEEDGDLLFNYLITAATIIILMSNFIYAVWKVWMRLCGF